MARSDLGSLGRRPALGRVTGERSSACTFLGSQSVALVDTSPWGVFCRVSLAETIPAMWTAALWIFATLMSEVSVTDLFQIGTLAVVSTVGFALSGEATH